MTAIQRPVVQFDQHSASYAASWQDQLRELRENNPVAWTESHGGFWIITRHDDIVHIERTPEIFSCDNDIDNVRQGAQGIRIPRNPFRFNLNESDPPEHGRLRKLEAPFFTPRALQKWLELTREIVNLQIDTIIDKGHGDMVEDICIPTPAQVTLRLVGVPKDEWRDYMDASFGAFLPTDHPDYPLPQRMRIGKRIDELMAMRRAEPQDDVITTLVNAKVDGEPLPGPVAKGMLQSLLFGGFDTTAATSANALRWLADHPELHQRLREDDAYLSRAVDEFLRFFPPIVGGLSRTVVQETELRGQKLKPGERVLLMFNSGNFDRDLFENPEEMDFDRANAKQHLAFGAGPHRCLGALLGAAEVGIIIRAVLKRLPDYRIDHEKERRFPSMGLANGWLAMPFHFSIGTKSA